MKEKLILINNVVWDYCTEQFNAAFKNIIFGSDALISSACTTPLLHLPMFILAFFIHIFCFLSHSEDIILAAHL